MGELPAITNSTVLDKLCYVRFGQGRAACARAVRDEMLTCLASLPKPPPVSGTTIRKWFADIDGGRPNTPRRPGALVFLREYLLKNIDRDALNPDQKKVYRQIQQYLKHAFEGSLPDGAEELRSTDKVYFTNNGNVVIKTSGGSARSTSLAESLTGVYLSYKMRFSENLDKPIAQEVLRIFRRHRDIRFEQWYIRQEVGISKFEGVVLPMDHLLWFISMTNELPERLRITCFRRTDEINSDYDRHRWGIALSDIPFAGSHEPAACRIFMTHFPDPGDLDLFTRDQVKFLTEEELPDQIRSVVMRLIDNEVCASSVQGGIDPVFNKGKRVSDRLLKVDQRTIGAAIGVLRSGVQRVRGRTRARTPKE